MARGFIQGYVEQGGNTVTTDGRVSTTIVQRSFPSATVTVYNAGTLVLATIFSTEAGAPLANPFVADLDGHWGFWADQARYDVKFSGAGVVTPYTLFNLETIIASSLVDPGSNGFLARTAPNVLTPRTFLGTTSAITITSGDGSGNPVINLDVGLNFAGKTISGGTYITPSIANFSNALHTHQDNVGGGQLNATSIFNAGTVPVARLPIMVGDSGAGGVAGLVPAPGVGDSNKFLRGDGTWQVTGGGGGTPGSPSLSLQYNNAGAFGGVTGTSSDGTQVTWSSGVLRATSPRITTSVLDTNGNAIISLSAVGSAVNNLQVANAASGGHVVLSAVGAGADINLVWTPKGAGIITTSGNLQISNNAPQVALIDVNDSKTVRIALNGANWDFINDTAGATPIRIDTTTSSVTLVSDLFFSKTSTITISRPSNTDLTLSNSTGVFTFGQIPVLPGSDPTTLNQATRKSYVDNKQTRWSSNWTIADPSTYPLNTFTLSQGALVPSANFTARWVQVKFAGGSASGSFTVDIRKVPFGSLTSTTLATLTVNPGTLGVGVETDIGATALGDNDHLYIVLTSRSSPAQKDVWISIKGWQIPAN